MQRGLVEQEKQRLLAQSSRKNDALPFAAGDLIHPAIAEMLSADLRKRVAGNSDVSLVFKAQRASVGMTALQDKLPSSCGEEQRSFLLHHSDALSAGSRRQRVGNEAIQQNAAGERR